MSIFSQKLSLYTSLPGKDLFLLALVIILLFNLVGITASVKLSTLAKEAKTFYNSAGLSLLEISAKIVKAFALELRLATVHSQRRLIELVDDTLVVDSESAHGLSRYEAYTLIFAVADYVLQVEHKAIARLRKFLKTLIRLFSLASYAILSIFLINNDAQFIVASLLLFFAVVVCIFVQLIVNSFQNRKTIAIYEETGLEDEFADFKSLLMWRSLHEFAELHQLFIAMVHFLDPRSLIQLKKRN